MTTLFTCRHTQCNSTPFPIKKSRNRHETQATHQCAEGCSVCSNTHPTHTCTLCGKYTTKRKDNLVKHKKTCTIKHQHLLQLATATLMEQNTELPQTETGETPLPMDFDEAAESTLSDPPPIPSEPASPFPEPPSSLPPPSPPPPTPSEPASLSPQPPQPTLSDTTPAPSELSSPSPKKQRKLKLYESCSRTIKRRRYQRFRRLAVAQLNCNPENLAEIVQEGEKQAAPPPPQRNEKFNPEELAKFCNVFNINCHNFATAAHFLHWDYKWGDVQKEFQRVTDSTLQNPIPIQGTNAKTVGHEFRLLPYLKFALPRKHTTLTDGQVIDIKLALDGYEKEIVLTNILKGLPPQRRPSMRYALLKKLIPPIFRN